MLENLLFYSCSHGKMGSIHDNPSRWVDEGSVGWHLAKKLDLRLVNTSNPGASNFSIFENIVKNLPFFSKRDLVFVQWSYVNRIWCPEHYSIMPHYVNKLSKTYYKHFYNDLQEINKVFGYTLLLDSVVPNFYFNFADGSNLLEHFSPTTFQHIKSKKNYLNINESQLTHGFLKEQLTDGFHLTETGQEILANRYLDKMSIV
jgi:hypothetical protein